MRINKMITDPFLLADHLGDAGADVGVVGVQRGRVGRRRRGRGRARAGGRAALGRPPARLARSARARGLAARALARARLQPAQHRVLAAHVRQPADLQRLGHFQQRRDLLLRHVDLAAVHEVDDCLQIAVLYVAHYYYRVPARVVHEQRLEVGAARGEHHLVRFQALALTGERYVHKGLGLEQLVEAVREISLVVVPT